MKIETLRSESKGNLARVAATVTWEDCDRPAQDIYFETTSEFAQVLSCNPHAFLVASTIPAMHFGEQRISIDAEICPELQEGLITVMSWLRHWYELDRKPVQIESKSRNVSALNIPERAGWFFSGGVDSLSVLRANRLNFPLEHPASFKDGLTIYGISSGGNEVESATEFLDVFDQLVTTMSHVAKDAGVNLIPVYTNVRQLNIDTKFWSDEFQGAVLSSVAHAFNRRLTSVSISSTSHIASLYPHGSHPSLDPNYSSHDLKIKHSGITLSRLAKTELLADWDVALQNLKVCTKVRRMQPGMLNCGKCEKCLRTMTALLALGKLDKTNVFPNIDITEKLLVDTVYPDCSYLIFCYRELIPLLEMRGRHDLVRAIERITARYYETDWLGRVKKLISKPFSKSTGKAEQWDLSNSFTSS
jgi:hypothetical protein